MTNDPKARIIINVVTSEQQTTTTILENDTERNKKNKQSDSKMSESPFARLEAERDALARVEQSGRGSKTERGLNIRV